MTEPKHSEYVGVLDPPFSPSDYTWKTTYNVPEPVTYMENEPIFIVEDNTGGKYLYDGITTAIRDMIAFGSQVQVYKWDGKNNRYERYTVLHQTEVVEKESK